MPASRQMIEWPFVEELERRAVAFDAHDHVRGAREMDRRGIRARGRLSAGLR